MKFIEIDYDKAHSIVNSNKNLFWDGWDIIEYRYNPDAIYSNDARFINGKWAFVKTYKPNANGWKVPDKYGNR